MLVSLHLLVRFLPALASALPWRDKSQVSRHCVGYVGSPAAADLIHVSMVNWFTKECLTDAHSQNQLHFPWDPLTLILEDTNAVGKPCQ